jgi:hypothetical protein
VSDNAVVGCLGVLTIATRGAAGPGEAHVKVRGGSETFMAWSDEPLPRGTDILVIESRGTRTVDVVRWPETVVDPLDELL